MSIYKGRTLIAGNLNTTLNLPFTLFEYQWTDHILNNASWLRADTFSWQSGAVYVSAYNKLAEEYATGTSQTDDNGITYKMTDDGFKIALPDQEEAILSLYSSTGKAWYYILDTDNQRFKLPREKPFDGRAKGNGMTLGVTHGNSNYGLAGSDNISYSPRTVSEYGASVGSTPGTSVAIGNYLLGVTLDPSKSGIVLNRSNTDSQVYLYFYVGETVQNANLIAVGNLIESLTTCHVIIESYNNGGSWYRVYDDGWCEQGGDFINSNSVTFLKPFLDTSYSVFISYKNTTNTSTIGVSYVATNSQTATGFTIATSSVTRTWIAMGYVSA